MEKARRLLDGKFHEEDDDEEEKGEKEEKRKRRNKFANTPTSAFLLPFQFKIIGKRVVEKQREGHAQKNKEWV